MKNGYNRQDIGAQHEATTRQFLAGFPDLDLVEQASWEDLLEAGVIECITLVEAGLEEPGSEPVFGGFDGREEHVSGGVFDVTSWLMDGEINVEDW